MLEPSPSNGVEPPHSLDAERSVLGAILKDSDGIHIAMEFLDSPDHFYAPKHRMIYAAIKSLSEKFEPCDITTVANVLQNENNLEKIGGRVYLVDLVEGVVSTAHLKSHCKIVLENSTRRRLFYELTQISTNCYDNERPIHDTIGLAEQSLYSIRNDRASEGFRLMGSLLPSVSDKIKGYKTGETQRHFISTPFNTLNKKLLGLEPGEFVIIGGRPTRGKTQLALQISAFNAFMKNIPVGFVSVEMPSEQIGERLASLLTEIPLTRIKSGDISGEEEVAIVDGLSKIYNKPFYIDDSSDCHISEICSRIRRLKNEKDVQLVVVDYLQLVRGVRGAQNREREVADMCGKLKRLAGQLGIVLLCLSQLNRHNESEDRLVHLRDSGSIEQDADCVLFVSEEDGRGTYVEIAKRRQGERGKVYMDFENGWWIDGKNWKIKSGSQAKATA